MTSKAEPIKKIVANLVGLDFCNIIGLFLAGT
jgi:hypothetical protein